MTFDKGERLIGTRNDLRRRRRILARTFTHTGVKAALDKVKGSKAEASVAEFFSLSIDPPAGVSVPRFARNMASALAIAQSKRHAADYDLNAPVSVLDADLVYSRVVRAITEWREANSKEDRDIKHALCMLMLLKGKLRSDA